MRLLLICGSHSRHIAFHLGIAERFEIAGIVLMQRESTLPEPPAGVPERDHRNFVRHFRDRHEVEQAAFGAASAARLAACGPVLSVEPDALNTREVARFCADAKADVCVIFGPDLIRPPVFEVLPEYKINLHLGLSPWYRGSATLFWPFYNLEPQWAGATLHNISAAADAGPILHTCVPVMERGDGIHDIAAKTVLAARDDMRRLLDRLKSAGRLESKIQPWAGRLYLSRHFRPEHLRVIYDLYDNRMVDEYLNGSLGGPPPKLFQDNLSHG